MRHHSECKDLLIEALKYHLMPEQRGVLSNSRTRPRRCEGASTVLFAVGKAPPGRGSPLPRADSRANPLPRALGLLCALLCRPVRRWGEPVRHPRGLRGLRHADGPVAHGGLHVDAQGPGRRGCHREQAVRRGRVRRAGGQGGGCHHLCTEPSVLSALEEAGVVTGIQALGFSSAHPGFPASHTSSVFFFPPPVTTGPLIWPRWSPTTPSPIPGSPRCPWAPGGAAWA